MKCKKTLSIFLSLLFIVLSFPITSFAADDAEEITLDTVLEEYDSVDGDEGMIECEVEEFVEGVEETAEIEENTIIDNLNMTNGVPETSSLIDEEDVDEPIEIIDESNLNVDTSYLEEGEEEGSSSEEKLPEDMYETNASGPKLSLSSSAVTVNIGSTVKITASYSGYYGSVYLQYSKNNNKANASWGSWKNHKVPLSVTGRSKGTTAITVDLVAASSGKILATKIVTITVVQKAQLSVSKSKVDMISGSSSNIKVTVAGTVPGMYLAFGVSGSSATFSWGSWNCSTIPLNIKASGSGKTNVTVYLIGADGTKIASKTVTVNVTKAATLSASATSFSLNVGSKATVTMSYANASGNIHMGYSVSNSKTVCKWDTKWSGKSIKLFVSGKSAGTSTITVYLYNSSNQVLASKRITVTVKESPKLDCSVSSLSMATGLSKKIVYTFSGTSSSVYYTYSIANSKICSASWTGSWSGNSHGFTVYGKKPGSTSITVYLRRSSDSAVLASKTINVTITGTPDVTLNVTSKTLKVGGQATITATAKNINGSYTLSYGISGTNFSCSWSSKIKNNSANLTLKGTKSGTGTLTVYLKNSSGTVLAKKSITIKTETDENPNISFSVSSLTVKENSKTTFVVSYSGVSDSIYLSLSRNNNKIATSWGSWNKSSIPLSVTGKNIGNSVITVKLCRASNGAVLATKTINVTVTADASEVKNLTYRFENYPANIPVSTFKLAFGNTTKAERIYNAYHNAGGVCYGMATTSMLLRSGSSVSPSTFGKSSISGLYLNNKSSSLNMSVKTFIELMYVTQFSTISGNNRTFGIKNVCSAMSSNNRILILIWGPEGGHALVGYKLDSVNNRLYVYDCNWPNTERYITLKKNSSGSYTGWSYNLFDSTTWNESNGSIAFQYYSSVSNQWNKRGSLSVDSSWNVNALITNSDDFVIYDIEDNVVATYSQGTLDTSLDGISKVSPVSYNPYEHTEDSEYNMFYLPTDFYVVENRDNNVDTFKAEMINEELGIVVDTDAEIVAFGVDDSLDLCSTNISLDEGDLYEINLLSSREDEEDILLNGIGFEDDTNLDISLVDGELEYSNLYGASLSVDGESKNLVNIDSKRSMGGTITPLGNNEFLLGTDVTYSIIPKDGYVISDVKVNGESIGIVNEYTFFSLDENSTIDVEFEPLTPKVRSVSINDFSLYYKHSKQLKPSIVADSGVGYNVFYYSSDESVATVDSNGIVNGISRGEATITCIVRDEFGNTARTSCEVNVDFAFWQWLINIFLFGWIWY